MNGQIDEAIAEMWAFADKSHKPTSNRYQHANTIQSYIEWLEDMIGVDQSDRLYGLRREEIREEFER